MRATSDMTFAVNNSSNTEAKPVGIKHNMGSSKVNLPHRPEVNVKSIDKKRIRCQTDCKASFNNHHTAPCKLILLH